MIDVTLPKNQKALVLLCGPPASGKSTWGKNFAQKVGAVYVSTDELRAKLGKGEGDQSINAQVFAVATQKVQRSLSQGKHVVVDATNIDKGARRTFIKPAEEHGAYKIAVAFEVSREELLRRDAERTRHVGPEVIDNYLHKYKRPVEGDEFDKVIIKNG